MRQTKTVRAQQNTCNARSKEGETILSSHKKGTAPGKLSKHLSDLTGMGPFRKKQIVSSHKKGTAPNQTDCCVISQERDRSLKNKLLCHLTRKGLLFKQTKTPTKLSQQITKCEWISGTLSQHVAWLCDSRFLSQGVLYPPKRGQAVL